MPVKKEKEKITKTKKPVIKKTVKKSVKKPVKKVIKKTVKKSVKKPVIKKTVKMPIQKTVKEEVKESKIEQNWATGKRKTAVAQVQFFPKGKGKISINKKTVKEYFPVFDLFQIVLSPLKLLNQEKFFDFRIKVHGGGMKSQAEAVRLGITRALVSFNPEWRKELKSAGFLRRDARKKERKKPGLKRARRAPQWAKR